jgi:hypothetical protein
MVAEFSSAIRAGRQAQTDGAAGLRVLSVLEAVSNSLAVRGRPVAPRQFVESLTYQAAS